MKSYLTTILLLFLVCSFGQNKPLLYNFNHAPQSMLLNPGADYNYKFYFGLPALSGIHVNVGNTGFSAYDLLANDGVDFNTKLQSTINQLDNNDRFVLNQQIDLVSGGFRIGDWQDRKYISFGLYQETNLTVYIPKDLLELTLYGNADNLNRIYDLSQLNFGAELVSVFHLGFHKKVNEKFIFGARAKLYTSNYNVSSKHNSGSIYTTLSNTDDKVYNQVIDADLEVNTAGISEYIDSQYIDPNDVSGLLSKALFGGNLGAGIDIGFTYYPKKNTQITASLQDLGFITYSKDVRSYNLKGIYDYEGIQYSIDNNNLSINEFQDYIPLDSTSTKYTISRPLKLNTSYQYSFGVPPNEDCACSGPDKTYRNSVGGQLFIMKNPKAPMMALTGFYTRRLGIHLDVKATYTMDSYSFSNLGLGFATQLGPLNMYMMADNLLAYTDLAKAKNASMQFGINFVFKEKDILN